MCRRLPTALRLLARRRPLLPSAAFLNRVPRLVRGGALSAHLVLVRLLAPEAGRCKRRRAKRPFGWDNMLRHSQEVGYRAVPTEGVWARTASFYTSLMLLLSPQPVATSPIPWVCRSRVALFVSRSAEPPMRENSRALQAHWSCHRCGIDDEASVEFRRMSRSSCHKVSSKTSVNVGGLLLAAPFPHRQIGVFRLRGD